MSASRRAATRNAESGRIRASDTMAPRPMPGNTYALLACGMRIARPPISTGANGLPVATIARPSVQARMSDGRASVADVGFESGRIDRSLAALGHRADRRLREGAADAGRAEEDIRTEGGHDLVQVVAGRSGVEAHRRNGVPRQGRVRLVVVEARAPRDDQAVRVEHGDRVTGLGGRQAGLDHRHAQQPRDARARPPPRRPARTGCHQRPAGERSAPRIAARAMAAVPWMSSLNEQTQSR